MEITLLKTFIKESYDNLSALQRAENLSAERPRTPYQPIPRDDSHSTIHPPYVDGSIYPADPISASSAFEPPISRSPSNAPKSDNEESNTDDGVDNDDHTDGSSTKSKDQNDHDGVGTNRVTSSATGLISRVPDSNTFRESNLLVQMIPYTPGGADLVRSDRLIAGGHGPDSGTASATQEVTRSVRLLLDKWTTSGSALISNILDEEAARESVEALVGRPSLILDVANIVVSVSWPISMKSQTLNSIDTECRHPLFLFILHMTQDRMNILVVFKVVACRRLRLGSIHSHRTEVILMK